MRLPRYPRSVLLLVSLVICSVHDTAFSMPVAAMIMHSPLEQLVALQSDAENVTLLDSSPLRDNVAADVLSDTCVFGTLNSPVGKIIGLEIGFYLIVMLLTPVFMILAILVAAPLFGGASPALAMAALIIVVDHIRIHFPTWKYLGPGDKYQAGISASRYALGLNAFMYVFTALFVVALTVGGLAFALVILFSNEHHETLNQRIRFRIPRRLFLIQTSVGSLGAIGLTYYAIHRSYQNGVLAIYRGSAGDSLNSEKCSGPQAWRTLSTLQKFALVNFVIGPFLGLVPCLGMMWSVVSIVVDSVCASRESNAYTRSSAIINIVAQSLELIQGILAFSPRRPESEPDSFVA
jgi:hypothetical protein